MNNDNTPIINAELDAIDLRIKDAIRAMTPVTERIKFRTAQLAYEAAIQDYYKYCRKEGR